MEKQSFDLNELLQRILLEAHAAWRYRWHALVLSWAVAMVGTLLVFGIPDKYESRAQVYADTTALTNPLLRGVAVQQDVRQRLEIITHTLLSRPNLESVAKKTGLALRATTPSAQASLLDALGSSVRVTDTGTRNLYNISYSNTDPKMARNVVQAFLQILMNETLGANTSSTTTAQNFLQQQVRIYNQRLNDALDKLATFKKSHVGYIPDAGGGAYAASLGEARAKLDTLQGQYNTALTKQAMVRKQMRGLATGPGSAGIDPRVQEINAQIASSEQHLNKLLLRYTEAYPDVVATRRMIKQLRQRRDGIKNQTTDQSLASLSTDNPVYQGRQNNLYASQVNLRMLASQIAQQKQRVAILVAQQAKTLDVQAQLQQLTRDYATTKKQYDELVMRLNTAQLSQAASQSGNNLKFRVVNPPQVPLSPSSPKRGLLLIVVFLFAIGMGGAFAWFMHTIRPVFSNMKSLGDFSEHPVIGAFQLIEPLAQRVGRRRQLVGFCAGVTLLAGAMLVGFAFSGPIADIVQQVFVVNIV